MAADWTFDGPGYVPTLRFDWPIEEAGEHVADDSGVSFTQWVELARAFVDELGEDNVRRRT